MTVSIEIVISLMSVAFSGGLFVGMLTVRFITRKECEKNRETAWKRIDAIQDCMTGGRYQFQVTLIPATETRGGE
jgi:hypothetical protein